MPVSFSQAALGCEIEAPTVDGKSTLKILPGTQSGTQFTLRGKGAPRLNGGARGNEYISVVVETPTNLTPRQKRLFEELASENKEETHPLKKSFMDKIKSFI
jgi:molecular chaperone DnaJ